ncbi:ferritin-like domain-containing protein [Modestobacter muralis]|uniref:Ferritin-like domain-containing protein n=1 Tax=Modestobacter muralis TaxID=1608614 RepID=A0A6P0HBQ9_9ACTN|nr:ferritin-like domain-containing protein [Modestobacter muralis]NEN52429.1 ferritin-like domain-containing protein [Modestobacter muralis]
MPDAPSTAPSPTAAEDAALQSALAAAHTAVWGYAVVGAALPLEQREPVAAARQAHRDLRDRLAVLLTSRGVEPVGAEGGYALPFPVLSAVDAAVLAVTLEDGTSSAWTWVLDQATETGTRELGVAELGAAELRAVGWRTAAGRTPVTSPFPGLPD